MDILVTGGTVFVSRAIAEYFAAAGHNVYVLNRGSKPQPPSVTPMIADRHSLGDKLRSFHFDAVIDVTAYDADDVNDLLDALGDFGCYVLVSSSAVYPETLPQPFKETDECGANTIWGKYGTDKIAAEQALFNRVPDAYALRPPYLCGPMNNIYREAFVFECAEQDRTFLLPRDGSMKLQFCHIGDLCRAIAIILQKRPDKHILNIGYPEPISIIDWVSICYKPVGKTLRFENITDGTPQRSYFPFYDYEYLLDVSDMCSLMSELTPIEQSMKLSYEWFGNNRDNIVRKPLIEFIDTQMRKEKP